MNRIFQIKLFAGQLTPQHIVFHVNTLKIQGYSQANKGLSSLVITACSNELTERCRDSAESRVNGNQDFNWPSIRDNLIDGMTFTLSSFVLLIHPTIMKAICSCYNSVASTPNSITICSVNANNRGFSMRAVCVCVTIFDKVGCEQAQCVYVSACPCLSVWWD